VLSPILAFLPIRAFGLMMTFLPLNFIAYTVQMVGGFGATIRK
jgi:hypothetical protein